MDKEFDYCHFETGTEIEHILIQYINVIIIKFNHISKNKYACNKNNFNNGTVNM